MCAKLARNLPKHFNFEVDMLHLTMREGSGRCRLVLRSSGLVVVLTVLRVNDQSLVLQKTYETQTNSFLIRNNRLGQRKHNISYT